jgi:predicted aspartyl protease
MMVRYSYSQQISPPAPFVHVSLACPETKAEIADLPAQLDTAADRTVIPAELVDRLGLAPLDEIHVGGFGGQILLVRTYRIAVAIRGCQAKLVEVIAHSEEPFILLGRDLLNDRQLFLDGPGLALEIT